MVSKINTVFDESLETQMQSNVCFFVVVENKRLNNNEVKGEENILIKPIECFTLSRYEFRKLKIPKISVEGDFQIFPVVILMCFQQKVTFHSFP